jgi:hypothetical protein
VPRRWRSFISGYAEDASCKRLDEHENTHVLQKPFSLKLLADKVKEVMREQRRLAGVSQPAGNATAGDPLCRSAIRP